MYWDSNWLFFFKPRAQSLHICVTCPQKTIPFPARKGIIRSHVGPGLGNIVTHHLPKPQKDSLFKITKRSWNKLTCGPWERTFFIHFPEILLLVLSSLFLLAPKKNTPDPLAQKKSLSQVSLELVSNPFTALPKNSKCASSPKLPDTARARRFLESSTRKLGRIWC